MLISRLIKTQKERRPLKIVKARSYKNLDSGKFRQDLLTAPWSIPSVFDDLDDCYWAWTNVFDDIRNDYAPYKETKIRIDSLLWINPQIRHKMSKRYKYFLKAKCSNNGLLVKVQAIKR